MYIYMKQGRRYLQIIRSVVTVRVLADCYQHSSTCPHYPVTNNTPGYTPPTTHNYTRGLGMIQAFDQIEACMYLQIISVPYLLVHNELYVLLKNKIHKKQIAKSPGTKHDVYTANNR